MRLLLVLVLLAACSDHDAAPLKREPERQRRVIEPPSGRVRPLPPHAIRADGVGPYRLGASLAELLDELPSGPKIAQLDIPGVVHRSLLHAEDDAVLIGGEPVGKASFVAVIGGEVARTESGIHVGSTRDELAHALGPFVEDPDHARDPRVVVPSGLRNARVVLENGDRVAAIVISAESEAPRANRVENGCSRPATEEPKKFGACLSAGGEVVSSEGDEIVVRAPDSEKILAQTRVSGLVYAAALRDPADGRDQLVAISRAEDAQMRSWLLTAFRLEGARLVKVIEPTVLYQLTGANARWIGAELRDLDLYLELTNRPDAIEVGGLLTSRAGDKIRDIVVISSIPAPRRHAKSAPAEAVEQGSATNPDRKGKP